MANERLYQFPAKTSPVPADIVYIGDSANSNNEVYSTIAQIIAAYPNLSGIGGLTLGANTYPYSNASSVITAGTISALAVTLLADSTIGTMQSTLGYQSAPIASQFAGWDANANLSANSLINGYATTVTAASTTTLTVASAGLQFFTGSTTQTVVMPVTSTLVLGQPYKIVNNSSGNVTVQSSGGNTIQVMAANTSLVLNCILTSGTTAASWYASYSLENTITFPLSLANGCTNASLTASAGAVAYSTASAMAFSAVGSSGQIFVSQGTSAPIWSTTTYPLTNAINTIMYASSANVLGVISPVNSAVLISSVTGVPSMSQTLPTAVQSNITQLGTQTQALNMGTNAINNVTDPVNAQDAATKNYVDNIATGGAAPVVAASTAALTVTYSNGVSGVGATLTNAGAQATFSLDGQSPTVGQRVLIKNQASTFQNGIYLVTSVGSGATNWVLTRAIDYDTPSDINDTGVIPVTNGTVNSNTGWVNTTTMVTVGTTAVTFVQFGASYPISLANGGTGASLTASNNGLVYSTSSALAILATANNGILLTSSTGVPLIATTFGQGLVVASSQLSVGGANNIPFNTGHGIQDSNGNSLLLFTVTASAVNYINITNNSTTNKPIIAATGSDTNVLLSLQGKGNSGTEVQGTTAAGNATSGYVGELISSVIANASAISLSNGVNKDLTSINLTAGDWDVWGNAQITSSAGMTQCSVWISTNSATLPDSSLYNTLIISTSYGTIGMNAPIVRVNVSSTTTVYISVGAAFSSGTANMRGGIYARRVR